MDFGDDVIERGRSAERIAAVGAFIVPSQMDLITGAAARDQARLVNVVVFH